jgi:lipid A 3-O-deacylase
MRFWVRRSCHAFRVAVVGSVWQVSLAILIVAAPLFGTKADPRAPFADLPIINEFRFGVLGADLEEGGGSDDTVALNAELLTAPLGYSTNETILDVLLHPRLHFGANINLDRDGVNQVYAGLTWDFHLTDSLFLETSFGGAVHDGETAGNDPDSYGCTLNFRESVSLGIALSENLSLMVSVDHMSNGGLCDQNQGLTNAGVRLGYRW